MKQSLALDILKSGRNVFLTGSAGSGKTYTLNAYIDFLQSKKARVAVTASTGIASTHLGGMTIHSWSGIGIRDRLSKHDINDIISKRYTAKRFKKTDVLIIDEVSMIAPHTLDLVDRVVRAGRGDLRSPFGGIQVVVCGDFFQLPPVISNQTQDDSLFSDEKEKTFAYDASSWEEAGFAICYLEEQYRHKEDGNLSSLLNAIRSGEVDEEIRQQVDGIIQESSKKNILSETHLYTHNRHVDHINEKKLRVLPGGSKRYIMKEGGKEPLVALLKRSCLAVQELILKKGASVVFIKNDPENRYVNGTLGTVIDFDEEGIPLIKTRSGAIIPAYPQTWKLEDEGRELAELRQIPLRLAWALTVHKSQGMTLDSACIDLSGSFVPGMGYVALSRVRSLEGLHLLGINEAGFQVHPHVLEKDKEFISLAQEEEKEWKNLSPKEQQEAHQKFFDRFSSKKKKDDSTYKKTKMLLEKKYTLDDMSIERGVTPETILSHIEKLLEKKEIDQDAIEYLVLDIPEGDRDRIFKTFMESEEKKLSPVFSKLQGKFSYKELRLVRMLLP